MRLPRLAPLLLCAAVMVGCSSKADVSGKVTYKGKAVVSGTVSMIASDGVQHATSINPDGTYTIPGVPTGDAKFGVNSPNTNAVRGGAATAPKNAATDFAPAVPTAAAPVSDGWFPIPDKYGDPVKSGLTGKVVSPKATVDLPLE